MSHDWKNPTDSITPLLDTIIKVIPAPEKVEGVLRMKITSLDFSSFTGRIAIGRIHQGSILEGQSLGLTKKDGSIKRVRIKELHVFEGLGKRKVERVDCGDICAVTGIDDFEIGRDDHKWSTLWSSVVTQFHFLVN